MVRENIDDFGMTVSDALRDTIDQFQKQGVDLANIDTSGGIGKEEALTTITALIQSAEQFLKEKSLESEDSLLKHIQSATTICSKAYNLYLRNINLFNERGGVNALHLLLEPQVPPTLLCKAMDLLQLVSSLNGTSLY